MRAVESSRTLSNASQVELAHREIAVADALPIPVRSTPIISPQ
jgi:hypothetical protein